MTIKVDTAEAKAVLAKLNAKLAVRGGAVGPNGSAKRGKWEIDGRAATATEARALNSVVPSGVGARIIEA